MIFYLLFHSSTQHYANHIYCLFFAFIAFEFFYKLKKTSKDQTKQKQLELFLGGLAVLLILNMIAAFTLTLYNISAFYALKVVSAEVIIYIIKSILLNLVLTALPATLLGVICALIFKRVLAYIFLILFIIITSPLSEILADTLLFKNNINLFPISDFLNFSTPSLSWTPNFMSGYSVLPYRLELILIWVFALSTIFCLIVLPNNRKKILTIILSLGLCVTNVILYLQPSSKLLMSNNPVEGADADFWYYLNVEQKEETPAFSVSSYNIDINITNKLNVTATLTVSSSLPEYKFTLYHGYMISNVRNQDGRVMEFKQEGDYFIVYSDSFVSEIVIEYSGYSAKFYSNKQGAVLPGFFPYYPHSGFAKIYSLEDQTYTKMQLDKAAHFEISIKGGKNVYTSLQEFEDNEFYGESTGVTIVSGYIKDRNVNGIEVIYPYLDTMNFTQDSLDEFVAEFIKGYRGSDKVNKVIILPSLNLKYMETTVLDDYVLARTFYYLAEICNEIQE